MTVTIAQPGNIWTQLDSVDAGGVSTIRVNGLGPTLVGPGSINAALTFGRTHSAGAFATSLGSDGVTWAEYAANVARYYGTLQWLLMETARTNVLRNPRGEGGVVGTPGTIPTNWNANAFQSLTRNVASIGTQFGLPRAGLQYVGTASGTGNGGAFFETAAGPAAVSGQTFTATTGAFIAAGTLAGGLTLIRNTIQGTNGVSATENTQDTTVFANITAALRRFSVTRTMNNAGTTNVRTSFELGTAIGNITDVTLGICAPQIEEGAFASTPILPPVGTPGAATRNADLLSGTLAGLSLPLNSTFFFKGLLVATATGAVQQLLELNDGSANNAYGLRCASGSALAQGYRITSGVTSAANAGTIMAGTPFGIGISIDGAGGALISFGGAASVAVAGGPVAGIVDIDIGPMSGQIGLIRALPVPLAAAALEAAVAAL